MKEKNFMLLLFCCIMLGMIMTQGDDLNLRTSIRKLADLSTQNVKITAPEIIKYEAGALNKFIISGPTFFDSDASFTVMLNTKQVPLKPLGDTITTENHFKVTADHNLELYVDLPTAPSADAKYEIFLQNESTKTPRNIGELIKFTTPTPYGLVKSTEDLSIDVTLIEALKTGDTLTIGKSATPCTGTGLAYTCNVAKGFLPEITLIVYTKTYVTYESYYTVYSIKEFCHDFIGGVAFVQIQVLNNDSNELLLKIGDKTSIRHNKEQMRTFTFDKNAITTSNQIINLIRNNIHTFTTNHTFKTNFEICTKSPLAIDKDSEFDLTFTSDITKDHITITYKEPGGTNSKTATYDINTSDSTKITVKASSSSSSSFALTGKYVFTIADKDLPTLSFTIVSYPITPPILGNMGIFYYTGTSSLKSSTLVSFTEDVTDLSIFSKVVASRSDQVIELNLSKDSSNKDFKLAIITPMQEGMWGKYDTLKFYEVDGTTPRFTINNFIMINDDTIPQSLSDTYASEVKIIEKMKSVEVSFEQEIYAEYFEDQNVEQARLSIDGYTLTKTAGKDKTMTITKDGEGFLATEKLQLKVYERTAITINLKKVICKKYQIIDTNICRYCTAPTGYFDVDTNQCINCPTTKFTYDGKACFTSCSQIVVAPGEKIYKEDSTCVKSCSPSHKLNDDSTECVLIDILDNTNTSGSFYANKLLVLISAFVLFS